MAGILLIRGGTVIDPSRGFMGKEDVLVCGNRIAVGLPQGQFGADEVIDASGCLVMPGLIDNHAHIFQGGTEAGFAPDLSLLPMGVTAAVDAGSTGVANCEAFMEAVVKRSQMRLFCQINVSSMGQAVESYPENLDPQYFNRTKMKELMEKYPGRITGIKVRCGQEILGEFGLRPLVAAAELAEELGCQLTVHTTNPPGDVADIAALLRKGDVFCHCFQGKGSSIVDAAGRVKEKIWEARRRGVVFDTADARVNHSYPVIRGALEQGFNPDVISTDLTRGSLFGEMLFGLPLVMSKYLGLGLSLFEVVKACTAVPATLLGVEGEMGTLAPGALADIAVFELVDKEVVFKNRLGESFTGGQLLIPKLTLLDGKVVFRQVGFSF